ncbi:hypothetical protein NE236_34485 [Actinoallomurus purpureus]|uniref:hypothetical protein n=1 Tax=Actinoallomurus purpureus TaxID=478114 RepID=UPI0020936812|nr:hypothetical protein [Actinoallomurus purpureus]MCO6010087.1 hypothetical protein [Actinoallomurus purpureus]
MDEQAGSEQDELRDLLRRADSSIRIPPGLNDRVMGTTGAGDRWRARRWSRWQPVAAAIAAAVLAGGSFAAGTKFGRHTERSVRPVTAGALPADLTVYNAERPCQSLHTIECGISIRDISRVKGSITVARVWHGDVVHADCVTADADPVTDEAGVSSTRWYHVTLPHSGVTGWLPGVRTRNTVEIPLCTTH